MTEFLTHNSGTLAYDVTGEGPLIVLSHGMGDTREAYRFLAPLLVEAGYRVAAADLRGHGESSTGWASYTRTDTAGDLVALVEHLGGGPAVIVGHSFSGGSATIAAAHPAVAAVVEIGPFTRVPKIAFGALFTNAHYRTGLVRLLRTGITGNVDTWLSYPDHAYPGAKPADWAERQAALATTLREDGRMKAVQKMGRSAPKDAEAALPALGVPALIVMGTLDPDWADPRAEAEGIVAAMPSGLGSVVMIEGAGHYPHAQFPHEVAAAVLSFLKEIVSA
ncbi:alpha/beta hydrolase [Nonomuraea angiospora]|uniref:alpha/beta fold hydrolase n=1 Tax=Nonomuraea angiospora TaxID=46172 RepID=UPI0033295BE5